MENRQLLYSSGCLLSLSDDTNGIATPTISSQEALSEFITDLTSVIKSRSNDDIFVNILGLDQEASPTNVISIIHHIGTLQTAQSRDIIDKLHAITDIIGFFSLFTNGCIIDLSFTFNVSTLKLQTFNIEVKKISLIPSMESLNSASGNNLERFRALKTSLETLGFSTEEIYQIEDVLTVLSTLNELDLMESWQSLRSLNTKNLALLCKLSKVLGNTPMDLIFSLLTTDTKRDSNPGHSLRVKRVRDHLIHALYHSLMEFLFIEINHKMTLKGITSNDQQRVHILYLPHTLPMNETDTNNVIKIQKDDISKFTQNEVQYLMDTFWIEVMKHGKCKNQETKSSQSSNTMNSPRDECHDRDVRSLRNALNTVHSEQPDHPNSRYSKIYKSRKCTKSFNPLLSMTSPEFHQEITRRPLWMNYGKNSRKKKSNSHQQTFNVSYRNHTVSYDIVDNEMNDNTAITTDRDQYIFDFMKLIQRHHTKQEKCYLNGISSFWIQRHSQNKIETQLNGLHAHDQTMKFMEERIQRMKESENEILWIFHSNKGKQSLSKELRYYEFDHFSTFSDMNNHVPFRMFSPLQQSARMDAERRLRSRVLDTESFSECKSRSTTLSTHSIEIDTNIGVSKEWEMSQITLDHDMLREIKYQVSSCCDEIDKFKKEIGNIFENMMQDIIDESIRLRAISQSHQNRMKQKESRYENRIRTLERKLTENVKNEEEMRTQLNAIRTKTLMLLKNTVNHRDALQQELKESHHRNNELMLKIEEMSREKDEIQSKLSSRDRHGNEMEEKLGETLKENETLKQKVVDRETELAEFHDAFEQSRSIIERLMGYIKTLQQERGTIIQSKSEGVGNPLGVFVPHFDRRTSEEVPQSLVCTSDTLNEVVSQQDHF